MSEPLIGVATIILKGDEVLMGKRKGSHGEGTWSFPGGKPKINEPITECALREVKEETGLKIKLIDAFPSAETEDYFSTGEHFRTLFLRARYISGKPKVMEPDKCEEWRWYRWNNLPGPLFLPIKNLIEGRNYSINRYFEQK